MDASIKITMVCVVILLESQPMSTNRQTILLCQDMFHFDKIWDNLPQKEK